VQDDFLADTRVAELIDCARQRRARGDFADARIGADLSLQRREEVRGDRICWLAEPLFPAERALLADLDRLRMDFNREGYLGLFDLELHYACYPAGAGYARHVDQLHGRDQRVVSLVLYLNEHWRPQAGGELRIFGAADAHRDVAPIAGRLVCFLADVTEHAVLPTHRTRLSITGWFRRRPREAAWSAPG